MANSRASTERRLRAAVKAGAYWELDQLLTVYRREVEAGWKAAESVAARRELAGDVTALLQWARHSILAASAHAQRRLLHLMRQDAYAASARPMLDQLELDA